MVEIKVKLGGKERYDLVRDAVCEALVGNRAFIENDIIVTDQFEDEDTLCIVLGDETNQHTVTVNAELTARPQYRVKVEGES